MLVVFLDVTHTVNTVSEYGSEPCPGCPAVGPPPFLLQGCSLHVGLGPLAGPRAPGDGEPVGPLSSC